MLDQAVAGLEKRGYRAVAVPIGRLEEVRGRYEDLAREGKLDDEFARGLLRNLTLEPPESMPDAASLVVVASRDPEVLCVFECRGEEVRVTVPPTYLHLREKGAKVERELEKLLPPGSRVGCLLNAPHKSLAVRSGLALYGRNNITYVPGMGSFHLLTTVCTDVPCEGVEWSAPAMMPACEFCEACVAACPTGAIPQDRVLLRAELCVTLWNEKPEGVPFPDWLEPDWHDSLVGCMMCQRACPENADYVGFSEDGPRFTGDETERLLRGGAPEDLTDELRGKLEKWDLLEWLAVLPRNLAVHLPGAVSG